MLLDVAYDSTTDLRSGVAVDSGGLIVNLLSGWSWQHAVLKYGGIRAGYEGRTL